MGNFDQVTIKKPRWPPINIVIMWNHYIHSAKCFKKLSNWRMGLSSISPLRLSFSNPSLLSVAAPPPRVHFHNLNIAYNGLKQLLYFQGCQSKIVKLYSLWWHGMNNRVKIEGATPRSSGRPPQKKSAKRGWGGFGQSIQISSSTRKFFLYFTFSGVNIKIRPSGKIWPSLEKRLFFPC